MGKTTNKELAKDISSRIQELLNETALKLEGLAILCGIGKSAMKSYFSKTIPISLENIAKICSPFSLDLSVFLDFKKPLPADLKQQARFKNFYKTHIKKNPEYFVILPNPNEINSYVKHDKDRLDFVVRETDYLYSPKLISEMVEDLKKDYNLEFESGRLSQRLKSYPDLLDKIPSIKLNKDGSKSKKEVFKYVRKKK